MKLDSGCVGCFAGLSCGARVEIINLLQKNGPMSVLEIVKNFNQSQPTITHHLKYLKEVKILTSKKEGRKVYYSLHPRCKEEICDLFS